MQPQRAHEIERAVEIGLQHSDLSSADSERPPSSEIQRHVLRALPRRQLVHKIEAAQRLTAHGAPGGF